MITAEALRDLLDYAPETGLFHWRKPRRKVRVGGVAGCDNGRYWVIRIDDHLYVAHRLAWLHVHGEWPKGHIDHVNGDGRDNRICNLREATRSQNMANSKVKSSSKTGIKGVAICGNKFAAYIGGRKKTHLGMFDTSEAAHEAYMAAARARHGEFARSA